MIALPLTRGQRLWFVPSVLSRVAPHVVTVCRVGTKWAYLDTYDGLRVDIATGALERTPCSGSIVGTLYASKEQHAQVTSVRKAWADLTKQIRERSMFGRMPQGLTHEAIEQARKLLKLEAP